MAKKKPTSTGLLFETNERQRQYVEKQEADGSGLGLVFADAFIRGMRDIGYKDLAWAMCEEVDNSIQASANLVAIRFGYEKPNKTQSKPDMIAVIDNGVGMIPKMISYAVRWGGTDREGDRKGFGRYGYGLPSSAVSFCTKYTVYSKTQGGEWHSVQVDIGALADCANDVSKTNELLKPREQSPPDWVLEGNPHCDPKTFESGTIIVHESLDRLQWAKVATIKSKLLQRFGVNYRHWFPKIKIVVDETVADPVDPLFLMENCRYFDATPVSAVRIETKSFEVETTRGTKGIVKIRAALLPVNFPFDPTDQPVSKESGLRGVKQHKGRFEIMRDYNGLLVCREGRQIDCIQPRWTKFQNWDTRVKIEIDFDPELDEFFGITTAKQQIILEDVMWDKLESTGGGNIKQLVKDMRRQLDDDMAKLKAKADAATGDLAPRPSEVAMAETVRFKPRTDKPSDRKKAKAQEELEAAANATSQSTGRPPDEVLDDLETRTKQRPYEVEFQAIPEGPFYRPKRLGEQKRLIINTLHPFYGRVYDSSPAIKAALEVILFVLAEGELEAEGDYESFYRSARNNWSERLQHALVELKHEDDLRDEAAVDAERNESADVPQD